jgi:hypothetical protein
MAVDPDRFVDIVDHCLNVHLEVDGHYEWLDRTTRTRSYEWQIYPRHNDRQSVGGECYLTFQKDEDGSTVVDLRATVEFADIDRVKSTELLERAQAYVDRADVEYRIVEEYSEKTQRFHVFIGTTLFLEKETLVREEEVERKVDRHLEALAEFADEVDRMVYLESRHIT